MRPTHRIRLNFVVQMLHPQLIGMQKLYCWLVVVDVMVILPSYQDTILDSDSTDEEKDPVVQVLHFFLTVSFLNLSRRLW